MKRGHSLIAGSLAVFVLFLRCSTNNPADDDRTAPVITQQPQSQTVTVGDSLTFTVVATGNPAPTYQWRKDGSNILAEFSSFTRSSVQYSDAGTYSVVVNNSEGSVTSSGAVLTVLAFSVLCSDSFAYPLYQDTLSSMTCPQQIGPITIGSASSFLQALLKVSDTVPLPAGAFNTTINVPLTGIDTVVFDTASPPLLVIVRNLSAATVNNLAITVFDSVRNIAALGPNDTAALLFPVAGWDSVLGRKTGKTIAASTLSGVRVQQDSASPGGANVSVTFDFNGLTAYEATILSKFVSFSKSFVKDFYLGDSLEIHYLDILGGFFIIAVANASDLYLEMDVSMFNLWRTSWCAAHSPAAYEKVGDLAGLSTFDSSLHYMGKDVTWLRVDPHDTAIDSITNATVNLSVCRLFPVWMFDSADMRLKSAAHIEFLVSPYPESADRFVNIKSTDSLRLSIAAPIFKYRQMLATVRQEYVIEGDTAKATVPSPWNTSSRDTSGKKAWTDISCVLCMPDSGAGQWVQASLDTLGIQFTFFSPAYPSLQAACSTSCFNARNNVSFMQQAEITSLMNRWPVSINIPVKATIPAGTRIRLINDLQNPLDPDYNNYMGRMKIGGRFIVNIYESLALFQ